MVISMVLSLILILEYQYKMNKNQLKKLMSSLDISQADLCRICFGQVSQSDRVIVSRWLSGAKPIPRWVKQMLNYYAIDQMKVSSWKKESKN